MDFPLEHRSLSVKQSDHFVRSHRPLSTGLGAGYLLLMMIPVVGWMFAPTFGTVAGTLKALEALEKTGRRLHPGHHQGDQARERIKRSVGNWGA